MMKAMADYLKVWTEAELFERFRTIFDVFCRETLEYRLTGVLLEAGQPQSLQAIAAKCGVSRTLVLPQGRLRRAIIKMESQGLISKQGAEERPRYALNHESPDYQLLEKIYAKGSVEPSRGRSSSSWLGD